MVEGEYMYILYMPNMLMVHILSYTDIWCCNALYVYNRTLHNVIIMCALTGQQVSTSLPQLPIS